MDRSEKKLHIKLSFSFCRTLCCTKPKRYPRAAEDLFVVSFENPQLFLDEVREHFKAKLTQNVYFVYFCLDL